MRVCDTVVKFGNYQLFCQEDEKDEFINNTYEQFYIQMYVNYPKFTYKRAFRFLYTMLNLYRDCKQIDYMSLNTTNVYDIALIFWNENNYIIFYEDGDGLNLCKELTEEYKRAFYGYVFRHFFGEGVRVPYKLIDKDVPLKPIKPIKHIRAR